MKTKAMNGKAATFLKQHKERVILGGVFFLFFVFVGGGFFLQSMRGSGKEPAKLAPKVVEMKLSQSGAALEQSTAADKGSAPFYLEPSPGELLQQLTSLENYNEGVIEGKYVGLRVLWPAYFFSLQENSGGRGTLILDVDEDGFGVVIEAEVELAAHPQLKEFTEGQKVWIGGEITAVDRSGTGTVYLKAENLALDGDPVLAGAQRPAR